jgi:hypothetical protein
VILSNRANGASPLANGRSLSHKIVVKNIAGIEISEEDVGWGWCRRPEQALEVEHRLCQSWVDVFAPYCLVEVDVAFTLQSSGKVRSAPLTKDIRIVRRGADTNSTSRPGKRVAQVMSLEMSLVTTPWS